ncbi:MAG: hypothetical protein ABII06_07380 [Pseudomonadota bacterium]
MKRHFPSFATPDISIPILSGGGSLLFKSAAKKPSSGIAIRTNEAFAAAGPMADPVPEKISPVQYIEKNNSCILALLSLFGMWFLFSLCRRGKDG